eukprot:3941126-Rhodomonas_salina.4
MVLPGGDARGRAAPVSVQVGCYCHSVCCYALCGTGVAYAAVRCSVLSERMLLPQGGEGGGGAAAGL